MSDSYTKYIESEEKRTDERFDSFLVNADVYLFQQYLWIVSSLLFENAHCK